MFDFLGSSGRHVVLIMYSVSPLLSSIATGESEPGQEYCFFTVQRYRPLVFDGRMRPMNFAFF